MGSIMHADNPQEVNWSNGLSSGVGKKRNRRGRGRGRGRSRRGRGRGNNRRNRSRGRGRGRRRGRGRGRGRGRQNRLQAEKLGFRAVTTTKDKLDDELDEYFGRDPQERAKARLDADLDDYWNKTEEKETPTEEVAKETETEAQEEN